MDKLNIYLWTNGEWKLFSATLKDLQKELKKRNIFISDYAEIGNCAKIGNSAKIGNCAKIGDSAEIGNYAKIGDYAEIGYSAKIGNCAKIGDYAEIGNCAKIGNSAKIGNCAKIGDSAEIGKENIFSEYSLFHHLSVLSKDGKAILFKAVKEDLTASYNNYQYKVDRGDSQDLKPNQTIDCGEGWHFTNLPKAIEWAKKENLPKIISAEINVKDILHISWKVRVKAFSKVKVVNVDYLLK